MKYNRQAFLRATDEEKMELIRNEMGAGNYNGTFKADLLMMIEWMYGKLTEGRDT